MKRLLTLTLALLLAVTLVGIGGARNYACAEEDPYGGLWEITGIQDGDAYTSYAELNMKTYLDFLPSGAIYSVIVNGEDIHETYMAYQVTGENALDIYAGEDGLPGVYDPTTGVITVTNPDDTLISFVERVREDPQPDIRALVDHANEKQTYYGYRMTQNDQTIGMLETLLAMGMDPRDFYLTLDPDGTGYLQFGSETAGGEITWTDTAFTAEGESVSYIREGDHILLSIDGSNSVEFAPEGEIEALMAMKGIETARTEAVDVEATDLAGEWKLSKATAAGQTLSAEQIKEQGLEMSFRFNADGTATMISNGTPTNGLSWKVEGSELTLSVGSYDVFTLSYDGEYLVLSIGAKLYFEKIG